MNTQIIYQPRGRALEYAPLAASLYTGCTYGCRYCFVPAVLRKKPEVFHGGCGIRTDVIKKLEKDCKKMQGDPRTILLSFTCDPYPEGDINYTTREALLVLEQYKMQVTVLTKAIPLAIRDFDILARNDWSLGTTISCTSPQLTNKYEPGAPSFESRLGALVLAKQRGIRTWVSVEPVLNADEVLDFLKDSHEYVDHYKVGKLNSRCPELKELEASIDWSRFRRYANKALKGKSFYIKKDLAEYGI